MLKDQSLHHEILLLPKFNDISEGFKAKKKFNLLPQQNKEAVFYFFKLGFRPRNFSFEKKKIHSPTSEKKTEAVFIFYFF